MRFKITAADNSLPLVDELPGYDGIVRLEGVNGTGKTLTTHLLSVCAGIRPIDGETWLSFCQGIPHVVVEALDIEGATSIKWTIAGDTLREAAVQDPISWFESIEIDGTRVDDFDRIRDVFAVEILKGDVGLVETLARQIDAEANRANALRLGPIGSEVERLGYLVEQLNDALGRLRLDDIVERRTALATAVDLVERSKNERDAFKTHADRVEAVWKCSVDLASNQLSAGELATELEELNASVAATEQERAEIRAKLDELEKTVPDADQLAKDLKSGETSRKRALTLMSKATAALRDLYDAAGLDEDDHETDTDELVEALDAQREVTRSERIALDATPAVSDLLDDLTPRLQRAVDDGLGEQVLFHVSGITSVRVDATLTGLVGRKASLPGPDTSQEVLELDERAKQLATRVKALLAIPAAQEKLDSASDRLATAEEKLAKLSKQLGTDKAGTVEALRAREGEIERSLINFGGQVRKATQQRDRLPTETERKARQTWLNSELAALKVSEQALPAALETARKQLGEGVTNHDREVVREADLREGHTHDTTHLREMAAALISPGFEWLAFDIPDTNEASIEELLELLANARAVQELLDERQSDVQGVMDGVPSTLSSIASKLRGIEQPAPFARAELETWAASLAADWFDQTGVGDLLLDRDAHAISVDIKRRLVRWRIKDSDEDRVRPLEALSSGQQAFTFTKARLALMQQQSATVANRLLVLDEYGAFVSHDRLQVLERLLLEWRSEHEGDQILLILPAVQDYVGLSNTVSGTLQQEYLRKADDLRDPGYFTEALAPS